MSRLVLTQITIKKERSISSVTWYYLLQPSNASAPDSTNYGNPPPTYSDTGYGGWSTTEPTYTIGDNRVLYIMVQTLYSDGTFSYSTPTISSSYEAAKDAYNEVIEAEATISEFEDLGLKRGYIWDNMTYVAAHDDIPEYPAGSYIASGYLNAGNRVINRANSNTYGLNTWISTGGIKLRYNAINLMQLTTSNLEFYYPSTSSQQKKAISLGTNNAVNSLAFYGFNNDNKTMELTNSALKFYDPTDGTTEQAVLDTNGLILKKGGVKAGTANQSGFIYLSTENYGSYSINGSTGISDWKEIIGTKFGVRADGTLYANNAVISGTITVGDGSDLSAGLSAYSTTTQTQSYVTGLGYQTASDVSDAVSDGITNASVSDLSDGSSYSTTSQMNTAIGTATNDMATQTYVSNNYATQTALNTEINQRKAQYGTSSTGASTRIKVITCANFELVAGNEITVKFSTANTYTSNSIQLNINNKGAKDVWIANAVTSSTNQLLWGTDAYITFKYDGTQFIVVGEPRTWYGASTTAAATAAKTDTTAVIGCVICKGAKIELAMSNNNISTSATLNIQSTGAKNIYYGNTTTSPTVDNGHSWLGASTATFTFDGQYYRMAGQTVISGDSITTGTISANRLNISDIISNGSIVVNSDISDMATKTYVGNQGYQTAGNVNTIIGQTNVSALNDGSDYTKTANLGSTTAVQDAAKTASNYLGDTDSQAGVTLKAVNGTTTANTSTSNYIKINTNGLEVFKNGVSVALYGDTARIGKANNSAFHINSSSLQAYYMNGNTRTLYFEVSPTGIKYGPSLDTTVATTNQIPTTVASLSDASSYALKTYADDQASAAQAAAETTAQGYADTAEANASYSVEIQVTAIDYINNSATLVAIPYYQGSTTMPEGVTLSYQWYKNGTALSNTSTEPTIGGVDTNTLQLGEGADFGSSSTNAIYTCIISEAGEDI